MHGKLACGSWWEGNHARGWKYILTSTHNHRDEGKIDNPGWVLISLCAVLRLNSSSWHGEIVMYVVMWCSGLMVELLMTKRDWGSGGEWSSGYESIWKITGMTYLIIFRIPLIGVFTHQIWSDIYSLRNDSLTDTWHSLQNQFLIIISHITSHLTLFHPQLYHYFSTLSSVIPFNLTMPSSYRHTMNSVH